MIYVSSKDSIDNLQLDIIEMISLWESFFQPSENFFQLHQIMHLVSSIPLFGALHSWSELFGEQALGKSQTVVVNKESHKQWWSIIRKVYYGKTC